MWLKIVDLVDRLIDGITMYRLLMYYLIALVVLAVGLAAGGVIHYSAANILLTAAIVVFACWAINRILAAMFNAPYNPESSILTGLILALILPAQPTGTGLLFLLAASGLAMASKYILTIKEKHIFNPAAVAIFLTAIGPHQSASWWVGTADLLPLVIIGGILIARKIRRLDMVIAYLLITTVATIAFSIIGNASVGANLKFMVLSSPVLFLGFVMLTEPYTSPTTRINQYIYAAIVAIIIAPQFHIGRFYASPEFALIIGNLFAYLVGSKIKLFPTLLSKRQISRDSVEFEFEPDMKFSYKPGQYMEFTLPHDHPDSRGVRRYFTLSSSPTERNIKIGVKFYDESSTYKTRLIDLTASDSIVASEIAGDFVLPKDNQKKLLFIAGGIGITPFRSMLKYLIDTNDRRDIVLIYTISREEDIAYKSLLEEARQKLGIKTGYVISKKAAKTKLPYAINARLDTDLIMQIVPDLFDRTIYISGSHHMVESVEESLHSLNVSRANIRVDFFPGYA